MKKYALTGQGVLYPFCRAMYKMSGVDFGGNLLYTFFDRAEGNGFGVVPGRGATLTSLSLRGSNALDGYETANEMHTEGIFCKSAILFPFPNRLRDGRYTWRAEEYVFPINEPERGVAIHGFLRDAAFDVLHTKAGDSAEIVCRYIDAGTNPAYPFAFTMEVHFRMAGARLDVDFEVTNQHREPIPVGLGWHPYFTVGGSADELVLDLPPSERIEIDERMIPTGKRTPFDRFVGGRLLGAEAFDHCFAVRDRENPYTLSLRAGERKLSIHADAGKFPFYQIYTPPWRGSIALEPMTCNIDAFRNGEGLVEVPPGGSWRVGVSIEG